MKRSDLERHLRAHGCVFERRGNEHDIWLNLAASATAVVPRHREIKVGTARGICRTLRIPAPPTRRFLGHADETIEATIRGVIERKVENGHRNV